MFSVFGFRLSVGGFEVLVLVLVLGAVSRFVRVVGRDGRARPHFHGAAVKSRRAELFGSIDAVLIHCPRSCRFFRAFPCLSVAKICMSRSFLPCLSVFVRGQNLHVCVFLPLHGCVRR